MEYPVSLQNTDLESHISYLSYFPPIHSNLTNEIHATSCTLEKLRPAKYVHKIPCLSWNLKLQDHADKNVSVVTILSQMNLDYTLTSHVRSILILYQPPIYVQAFQAVSSLQCFRLLPLFYEQRQVYGHVHVRESVHLQVLLNQRTYLGFYILQ